MSEKKDEFAVFQTLIETGTRTLARAVLDLNTGWNNKEPEHKIAERIDLCRRLALPLAASMSEKKDAQGHQVEASIGRPAEFGTVVPEGYTMVFVQGFTDLMEALERADRKGYMPHSMQEQWDAFACITAMTAPDSSDSVPPLATGSTEASIRAQAMEDCAVICERYGGFSVAGAIRAAKEQ